MQSSEQRRGGARTGSGPKKKFAKVKIADLQALASNLQSLLSIAEVKAPALCNDPQWTGLRTHLEEEARKLGVNG